MASPFTLPRTLLIYAITIPLALLLGYLLISPSDPASFFSLLLVAFLLCVPLLMRSHHAMLLFSWNASVILFFLPGRPPMWTLMALLTLGFAVVNHVINRQKLFLHVPSVTRALLFLALVVILTAKLRGGIGVRVLGSSSYGGKGYFYILAAIAGYFALTSAAVPLQRVPTTLALFFLSALTTVAGHLAIAGGPAFYFLFNLFPVDIAMTQATAEITGQGMARYTGVSLAGVAVVSYLLARHGIRGTVTLTRPFRLLLFCSMVALAPIGGFRSLLALLGLTFAFQFVFEGLTRTKYLAGVLGAGSLVVVLLIPLAQHLPYQVQRAISFLPVDLDPLARFDAEGSTGWRIEMWKTLLPLLPNYVFLGKGYTIDPTDLYMTREDARRGFVSDYQGSIEAGDYHSGPLSVYIPFGSFGVLAFILFLIAAGRGLYLNYRFGDPALKNVNTFLFSVFLARAFIFVFVFGALNSELYQFTGFIGLSVALNGGVKKAPAPSGFPQILPVAA